jgi:outer membrane protein TolC
VAEEIAIDNQLFTRINKFSRKTKPLLQAQIINKRVSELQLKQVKTGRYPTIRVSTGYNFGQSQSSLGFITQSTSRGLNYGFNASLNLFWFSAK